MRNAFRVRWLGAISDGTQTAPSTEIQKAQRSANLRAAAAAIGATAAMAAWTVPLAGVWAAIAPGAAVCSLMIVALNCDLHRTLLIGSTLALLAALAGILPLPIVSSVIGIAVLLNQSPVELRGLSLSLLSLQSSYTGTAEALTSDALARVGLEAAGPAIVAGMFVMIPCWRQSPFILIGVGFCVAAALLARCAGLQPDAEAAVASFPMLATAAMLVGAGGRTSMVFGIMLWVALGLTWNFTPPRFGSVNEVHLLLPANRDAPEAPHFLGVAAALRFSGLRVNEPDNLDEIGSNSIVLLPWISMPIRSDEQSFATQFRTLANERRWTVIMFGEHDGMGDVDSRAESLAGRPLFRRDLTVPPDNDDVSRSLRSADLRAWPWWSPLNRGASTTAFDGRARVLLAADGWWAEPDLREWLWTGDFRWRPGDRGGRLSLAHAVGDRLGATWVAVGDTTPILSRQLIADPRPMLRILDLATLLPAMLLDIALAVGWSAYVVTLRCHQGQSKRTLPARLFGIFGTGTIAACLLFSQRATPSGDWRTLNIGESGYEITNFNAALAREPRLLELRWRLERFRSGVNGVMASRPEPTVSFLLVDGSAEFDGTRLSDCWRIGDLDATVTGPRLIDAQACRVDGGADVVLGDRSGAAAILIRRPSGPWLIVLDQHFLSEDAPIANTQWLLDTLERVGDR